jgi:Tetratricopeptide repeat
MSSTYHQLGILAQDRGDYETAEELYRNSLAINERLGDQAGVANSNPSISFGGCD